MDVGMIGLGRMGANMAERLIRRGHRVVGFDPNADARKRIEALGAASVVSLEALTKALGAPRVLWVMVPAGDVTEQTVAALSRLVAADDVVVDGGNSHYPDSQRRGGMLATRGAHYVDCGTSGGIWGLERGYSLSIGGDAEVVERLRPVFEALAPAPDQGWGRVGPVGAGHFAKMVHNGIEYGLMQAYAEGFAILGKKSDFAFDLRKVASIWSHGSVIQSWLLELVAAALEKNPGLDGIAPFVADSGEGRWTVAEAIALDVPAPVFTQSLLERLRSRDADSFTDKLLAAMRHEFGGHEVRRE